MNPFKYIYNKYFNKPKDYYIYIVVRQDLSIAQQFVQGSHAAIEMANAFDSFEKVPRLVLLGVPNKIELENVINKLMANDIKFASFYEPDNNEGLTAISTVPIISFEQRAVFKEYSLWRPN